MKNNHLIANYLILILIPLIITLIIQKFNIFDVQNLIFVYNGITTGLAITETEGLIFIALFILVLKAGFIFLISLYFKEKVKVFYAFNIGFISILTFLFYVIFMMQIYAT